MGVGEVMGSDYGDRFIFFVYGLEGIDGDFFVGVGGWCVYGGVGVVFSLLI